MTDYPTLYLPWAPSMNRYWRSVPMRGGCRVLLSKAGREYKERVQAVVLEHWRFPPMTGRLTIHITLNPPTKREMDIDNRVKPIFDALEHARVFENDSQIDAMIVKRGQVTTGGMAAAWLEERAERSTMMQEVGYIWDFDGTTEAGGLVEVVCLCGKNGERTWRGPNGLSITTHGDPEANDTPVWRHKAKALAHVTLETRFGSGWTAYERLEAVNKMLGIRP
jgi:crossover junction endodeoxyribonuclease RusA